MIVCAPLHTVSNSRYDDLLTKCDIFKMERDRRLKLVELMTVVEQAYGDELAKAGSHLDKMLPESVIWVVEEGGLEVSIEVDGRMVSVRASKHALPELNE